MISYTHHDAPTRFVEAEGVRFAYLRDIKMPFWSSAVSPTSSSIRSTPSTLNRIYRTHSLSLSRFGSRVALPVPGVVR